LEQEENVKFRRRIWSNEVDEEVACDMKIVEADLARDKEIEMV
jgi:hypothetical protein